MKKIIEQLKNKPDSAKIEELLTKACEIAGESPEDMCFVEFEDDEVKDWIYNKHPEYVEKLKAYLQNNSYANGPDYIYALCDDTEDENEVLKYVALYCSENPSKLDKIIEELEFQYEE